MPKNNQNLPPVPLPPPPDVSFSNRGTNNKKFLIIIGAFILFFSAIVVAGIISELRSAMEKTLKKSQQTTFLEEKLDYSTGSKIVEKQGIRMVFSFPETKCSNFDQGIKERRWLDDKTLEVKLRTLLNCADSIKGADFGIDGEKLSLKFEVATENPQANCVCGHDILYKFSGLEKKDYHFWINETEVVRDTIKTSASFDFEQLDPNANPDITSRMKSVYEMHDNKEQISNQRNYDDPKNDLGIDASTIQASFIPDASGNSIALAYAVAGNPVEGYLIDKNHRVLNNFQLSGNIDSGPNEVAMPTKNKFVVQSRIKDAKGLQKNAFLQYDFDSKRFEEILPADVSNMSEILYAFPFNEEDGLLIYGSEHYAKYSSTIYWKIRLYSPANPEGIQVAEMQTPKEKIDKFLWDGEKTFYFLMQENLWKINLN